MKFLNLIILILLFLLGACRESNIDPNETPSLVSSPAPFANHPPALDALTNENIPEGSPITTIDLNDGGDDLDFDNEPITYTCFFDTTSNNSLDASSANCSTLPGVVSFNSNTGIFNWTPNYSAAGLYEIWFTGTDGSLFDLAHVEITISGANQAPKIDSLSLANSGAENSAITAINLADGGDDLDDDGEALSYSCLYDTSLNDAFNGPGTSCASLPGSASFNSSTGLLSWTPGYGSAGTYEIWFTATDGALTDTEHVQFTISATNRAPNLDALSASVNASEGVALTAIDLSDGSDDFDVDGNTLSYSCLYDTNFNHAFDGPGIDCASLPGAVTFDASTGRFNWTPNYSASGSYELWFTATDGTLSDSDHTQITVANTNRAPVLDSLVNSIAGSEGSATTSLNLADSADDFDIDGDAITYSCVYETTINGTFNAPGTSCTSLPGTVSFNTATGVFNWTPDYSASGIYEVWFKATDSGSASSAQSLVQYTIANVNPLPAFAITGITGGSDVTLDARLDFITYPTISWQASAGADSYNVTVFQNNGTTAACSTATGITTTSYSFASCALTRGSDYKVRVTAKTTSGVSQNSNNDLYSFHVNSNPVANNDGPYYIVAGGNITVNVLADNLATTASDPDSDPDGDTISITAKTNGTKGTATISGSSIVFTGQAGVTGTDTFTYTISDSKGGTATGTVTIYIISGFTWTGAVNSNWSHTGNWCGAINATKTSCSGGAALPTTTSTVQFNSACINCTVNIDTAVDVSKVIMEADFPGTISQNGNTINVRTSWTQNGGTFSGGSASITVATNFTVNSGTFQSTSDTFRINRNQGCCGFTTNTFVIGAGAIFTHNNGTVYLYGDSSNSDGDSVGAFQLSAPDVSFYNLTVEGADISAAGGWNNTYVSIKTGTTITILNLLKQIDGKLIQGTINLLGNAEFTCTSPATCADNGGDVSYLSTDIQFNASMPIIQTLTTSGEARTPSLTISGTSTVNVISGNNDLTIMGNFKQTSGIFNAPAGWVKINATAAGCCSGNTEGFRLLGGTYNVNGSSLYLGGYNTNTSGGTPVVGIIQVPLGFTVNNFQYDHSYIYGPGSKWDFGTTNIFYVLGDFIHSDGYMLGTPQFIVSGDVTYTCASTLVCAERSNAKINFEGTGTQVVTVETGAGISYNTWTINKPAGPGSVVGLASDLTLNGASQDLTLLSGVLALDGYNLTVRDAAGGANNVLTMSANTVIDRGTVPGVIDAEVITKDPSAVITP